MAMTGEPPGRAGTPPGAMVDVSERDEGRMVEKEGAAFQKH